METEQKQKIEEEICHEFINQLDYNKHVESVLEKVPIYYSKENIWYLYDYEEYKWVIADRVDILNAVRKAVKITNISKSDVISNLLNALQMESRNNKPLELTKEQIQFKDKIINYVTGEETEASPKYFTFNPIPHKLGSSEDCPQIDKFFSEWVGDELKYDLYEWIAYHFIYDCPLEIIMCLNGAGSNGKTKFLDVMKHCLGKENINSGEFQNIFCERFGETLMFRKLGVIMGECDFNVLNKTSKFKSAISGESISVEFKGKNIMQYKNYSKFTISTNQLPMTSDNTDGFHRRWNIINFENKFEKKANLLDSIPEWEYENLCRKCVNLIKELLERGKLKHELSTDDKRRLYNRLSDPLTKFLNKYTVEDYNCFIPKQEFENTFKEWLKIKRYNIWTTNNINSQMSKIYEQKAKFLDPDDEGSPKPRSWVGVKWFNCDFVIKYKDPREKIKITEEVLKDETK